MSRMDELMDAIDLQDVFATAKYLDKLGFIAKDIDLETLKSISNEVYELVKSKGIQ